MAIVERGTYKLGLFKAVHMGARAVLTEELGEDAIATMSEQAVKMFVQMMASKRAADEEAADAATTELIAEEEMCATTAAKKAKQRVRKMATRWRPLSGGWQ